MMPAMKYTVECVSDYKPLASFLDGEQDSEDTL